MKIRVINKSKPGKAEWESVENLTGTKRGSGKFGHTGIKYI
jgi:dUTPase